MRGLNYGCGLLPVLLKRVFQEIVIASKKIEEKEKK